MLNKLITILELSKSTRNKLGYKLNDPTQRYAVAFWGTLQEHANSIIILIKNDSMWGIESILRTMIEAHFDLLNLGFVTDYHKRLEMNSFYQAAKLEKERHNIQNPYVPTITEEQPEQDFESLKEQLEKEGVNGETKIFEKLKLANAENVYKSVYWSLCQESHNNLVALIKRHYMIDKNGQINGIEFFRKKNNQETIIDTVAGMLTTSMEVIGKILNINLADEIQKATNELEEIRA